MEPQKPNSEPILPPASGQPVPMAPMPLPPQLGQPAAAAPTPTPVQVTGTPAVADDGDRIEKEWVNQVKQVVAHTTNDPYEQNRQFNKLKVDYLQKRYGKAIKSED